MYNTLSAQVNANKLSVMGNKTSITESCFENRYTLSFMILSLETALVWHNFL